MLSGRRTGNTFHELLKGQTWRGGGWECSLAFVGKLYLRVRKHLVLQPGTDRRLFITFSVVNTAAVMSLVSGSARLERRCSAAVVLYQVHLVLRRFHAKTLLLFWLGEKASNLHNSLRNMYVAPAPRFPLHTGGDEGGEPVADVARGPRACMFYLHAGTAEPVQDDLSCEIIRGETEGGHRRFFHTSAAACLIRSWLSPAF